MSVPEGTTAEELLTKYATDTGWSEHTKLALVCGFIDAQSFQVLERFDEFLEDKNECETRLESWQRAVGTGETLLGFHDWRRTYPARTR